jgi:hypothetical protein
LGFELKAEETLDETLDAKDEIDDPIAPTIDEDEVPEDIELEDIGLELAEESEIEEEAAEQEAEEQEAEEQDSHTPDLDFECKAEETLDAAEETLAETLDAKEEIDDPIAPTMDEAVPADIDEAEEEEAKEHEAEVQEAEEQESQTPVLGFELNAEETLDAKDEIDDPIAPAIDEDVPEDSEAPLCCNWASRGRLDKSTCDVQRGQVMYGVPLTS